MNCSLLRGFLAFLVLPGHTKQPGMAGARAGWDVVQGGTWSGAGAAACGSPLSDHAMGYSARTDPTVTGRATPTCSTLHPARRAQLSTHRHAGGGRRPRLWLPAAEMGFGRGKPWGQITLGSQGGKQGGEPEPGRGCKAGGQEPGASQGDPPAVQGVLPYPAFLHGSCLGTVWFYENLSFQSKITPVSSPQRCRKKNVTSKNCETERQSKRVPNLSLL